MPRLLKPQVAAVITDRQLHVSANLMFNRNNLTFFADYAGQHIEGKTADEVTTRLREVIKTHTTAEWYGVIEASSTVWHRNNRTTDFYAAQNSSVELKLDLSRFWVADMPGGGRIKANWAAADVNGNDQRRDLSRAWQSVTVIPSFPAEHRGETYLLYTEELWRVLTTAMSAIQEAQNQLMAILSKPEQLQLARDGLQLLAAPEKDARR
jgi:hypothetical protein